MDNVLCQKIYKMKGFDCEKCRELTLLGGLFEKCASRISLEPYGCQIFYVPSENTPNELAVPHHRRRSDPAPQIIKLYTYFSMPTSENLNNFDSILVKKIKVSLHCHAKIFSM